MFRIDWRDIDWLNEFHILDRPVDLNKANWKNQEEFFAWLETMRPNIISTHNGYAPVDIEMYGRILKCDLPLKMGYHDTRGNIPYYEHRKPLHAMPARGQSIIYPWRIVEGLRYDSVKAAQELDISFDDGKRGRVYAIQFRNIRSNSKIQRIGKYPLYTGVDPGRGQGNAFYIGWNQWNPEQERYQWLREMMLEGHSAYFFIPFLTGNEKDWHLAEIELHTQEDRQYYRDLFHEMQDPVWRLNMAYCDPAAISAKMAQAKDSIEAEWRTAGVPVSWNHAHRDFDTRISAARKVMGYTDICPIGCPILRTALANIEWPKEEESTNKTTQSNGYVHHPIYSHPTAAFEYHACFDPNRWDKKDKQETAPDQRVSRVGVYTMDVFDKQSNRREWY